MAIQPNELIAKQLTTEELLQLITGMHTTVANFLNRAIAEQNLGYAGEALQALNQVSSITKCLNTKLNGKITPTVVQ